MNCDITVGERGYVGLAAVKVPLYEGNVEGFRFDGDVPRVRSVAVLPCNWEVLTDVGLSVLTLEAVSAVVDRFLDHRVAWGDTTDVGTDFHDLARILMTHDARNGKRDDPLMRIDDSHTFVVRTPVNRVD